MSEPCHCGRDACFGQNRLRPGVTCVRDAYPKHTDLLAALASLVEQWRDTMLTDAKNVLTDPDQDGGGTYYLRGLRDARAKDIAALAALLKDSAATTDEQTENPLARSRPSMESGAGDIAATSPTPPPSSRTES